MSPFCKNERCNHHFPELKKTRVVWRGIFKFFGPIQIAALVVIMLCGVSMVYLMQANASATKGYQIKELKQAVAQLEDNNKELSLKYIGLQSMANIVARADEFNLVAVDDVEVINYMGSSVALR